MTTTEAEATPPRIEPAEILENERKRLKAAVLDQLTPPFTTGDAQEGDDDTPAITATDKVAHVWHALDASLLLELQGADRHAHPAAEADRVTLAAAAAYDRHRRRPSRRRSRWP